MKMWLNFISFSFLIIPTIFTLVFAKEVINLGILLPYDDQYPWSIHRVLPALELAVQSIHTQHILPDHEFILNVKDSKCSETYGPLSGIDLYFRKEVDVFFGPVCPYAVAPLARYAGFWNIPVISPGAPQPAFENKNEFKTLTRTLFTQKKLSQFLLKFTNIFNWSRFNLAYEDSEDNEYFFLGSAVFDILQTNEKMVSYQMINSHTDFSQVVENAFNSSSILISCASLASVREILIKMNEMGYNDGKHVFLHIDPFSDYDDLTTLWYKEGDDDARNSKAKLAAESMLTLTIRPPTSQEYREFSSEVKRRMVNKYNNVVVDEKPVNRYVASFFDSLLLYAITLNETLTSANRIPISDGFHITRQMWNRTMDGIDGYINIDSNGDRDIDLSVLDMNPVTHRFEEVGYYDGRHKAYMPVPGKPIHWGSDGSTVPSHTHVRGLK